ncbi:hypothetical protein G6N76_09320 [Rhizobium daejeonense]|uniref:Uncharacterized protein n=1 Tax=Rhizobium daejeonense TaxID=240521 RepID=A0A6M1RQG9_9HYPH|nr:hypothetical protein [Rhizobium daejeonense]NGO63874.1 hypothetical protein [Rhizobium daejeonense]
MASSFLQRSALILVPAAAFASCTGDRVMAPEDLAADTPRSSRHYVARQGQLEGRVEDIGEGRELLGPVGSPVAYAPETARGNGASAAIDYLDTPNLAGVENSSTETAEPTAKGGVLLSPEDTTEQAIASPADNAGSAYDIPEEGINIDAGLGVAGARELGEPQGLSQPMPAGQPVAAQILVPEGPMAIAEGSTAQPVVDGIGTENPVTLLPNEQAADGGL